MPALVRPMLAEAGTLPAQDEGWSYEIKWDGLRAILYVEDADIRIVTRNDRVVTVAYPELRPIGEQIGSSRVVLDGEIVALDDIGRPSFGRLQQRMHVTDAAKARRLAEEFPVTYMAFDLLYLDGRMLLDLPYDERRAQLEAMAFDGLLMGLTPAFRDASGADVLWAAREQGLEGVVAKRRASAYKPGRRSRDWVKVKIFRTQEVVVGGYTEGTGRRRGSIGALLLGIPEGDRLRYVGKVGTGFTDEELDALGSRFAPIRQIASPFAQRLPAAHEARATWVRPSEVGEVSFSEWTTEGRLRQASWRGIRPDKSPSDVRIER
ncbi:MAG TPA: non-homologous end-joining DNA ligase, partial [Acidimicrobiales bacterium]|nr:non-homologous end-joining DNA ligase [Acidimicrobiales bacterium]